MSWLEYLFRSIWYHGLNLGWKLLEGRVRVTFWISVQPLFSLSVGIHCSFPIGRATSVSVTPMKRLYHYLICAYEVFYMLNSRTGSIYKSIGLLLDWCTPPGNWVGKVLKNRWGDLACRHLYKLDCMCTKICVLDESR